jgi:hypothetical protein
LCVNEVLRWDVGRWTMDGSWWLVSGSWLLVVF